ncbi:YnbE family lipoprotein [Altererythrobacter sp. ZODW24]|uniref:YnbE family lipoprotein n=1 Tax=Altererythrobacter sp. ZODW24 TaxID=2185142 RepID=UPI000DF7C7F9
MIREKLTSACRAATSPKMDLGHSKQTTGALLALIIGSSAMTGCIQVNAPEDAIVIELNINIKQEVIYRLAEDAGNTIDENADIF